MVRSCTLLFLTLLKSLCLLCEMMLLETPIAHPMWCCVMILKQFATLAHVFFHYFAFRYLCLHLLLYCYLFLVYVFSFLLCLYFLDYVNHLFKSPFLTCCAACFYIMIISFCVSFLASVSLSVFPPFMLSFFFFCFLSCFLVYFFFVEI